MMTRQRHAEVPSQVAPLDVWHARPVQQGFEAEHA
jgi:hypothetical protein